MSTLISLNGQVEDSLAAFLTSNYKLEQVLGVDGGTQHLLRWNIKPTLVLGDMDSWDASLGTFTELRVPLLITYRDKDYTDGELALSLAKYLPVVFIGMTGSEADHFLGNLALLRKAHAMNIPALGYGTQETILYGQDFALHLTRGTQVSVVPLTTTVLTERGFKWELDDVIWRGDEVPPISNVVERDWQFVHGSNPFYLIVKGYWCPFSELKA